MPSASDYYCEFGLGETTRESTGRLGIEPSDPTLLPPRHAGGRVLQDSSTGYERGGLALIMGESIRPGEDSMATFAEPHVIVPAEIYEAMVSHCGEDAARRSCGILAGKPPCAEAIYRLRNIATNPDRYESEPNDLLAAFIDQRARGLAVVAIYHSSRPESDPRPNRWDIAENYYGHTPRVIVSLGKVIRVRAWKLTAHGYEELNLRVMPREESSGARRSTLPGTANGRAKRTGAGRTIHAVNDPFAHVRVATTVNGQIRRPG